MEKCQSAVGEKLQCRIKCKNMKKVFNLNEVTEHVGQAVAQHLFCIQCGTTQGNCYVGLVGFFFFVFEQGILLHQSEFDMKCVERQNTYSYE